jgi:hypothetical protein
MNCEDCFQKLKIILTLVSLNPGMFAYDVDHNYCSYPYRAYSADP